MSYYIKAPRQLHTAVSLPASKSISNRALILNALSYSPYDIQNLSDCDDTRVMKEAFLSNSTHFDIGAAGTAMRFMTAFLSKIVGEWTLTGSERMQQRPIRLLVEALRTLGAKIEYLGNEGFPPLRISGSALQGGDLSLKGNVSSQYISALLMIAPYMEKGLTLTLEGDIISRPYIDMTLQMMSQYGVNAVWNKNTIRIQPQEYIPVAFRVESDWSAASYWYEMAALSPASEIELYGLNKKSMQGDARVSEWYTQLGINTRFTHDGVVLSKGTHLSKKLVCNLTDQPDLAQTIVVTCALLNMPFRLSGLQSLRIKETDRIAALQNEMQKLGYVVSARNNSILEWDGERCEACPVPVIDTYEDHRMAMAFAPAALKLADGIIINHPEVVTKSYPAFWKHLEAAGFNINPDSL